MDKFAVVTDDNQQPGEKTASDLRCPICGSKVDTSGNVPRCPIHGTEPFEKKKQR